VNGHLADSNVLLDIVTDDPIWKAWSVGQLHRAAAANAILINPFIYAELAPAFHTETALESWFTTTELQRAPLPYAAAWPAARAFARYKKAGGTRTAPLPDFFIGAHAEVEGLTLITRDAARFQTYFPNVKLIVPV
jgi:predicted nucleic acid-binding protein